MRHVITDLERGRVRDLVRRDAAALPHAMQQRERPLGLRGLGTRLDRTRVRDHVRPRRLRGGFAAAAGARAARFGAAAVLGVADGTVFSLVLVGLGLQGGVRGGMR